MHTTDGWCLYTEFLEFQVGAQLIQVKFWAPIGCGWRHAREGVSPERHWAAAGRQGSISLPLGLPGGSRFNLIFVPTGDES